MLDIIKEVGIFIVIAQAILYFVPGESYVKYVKVMIGIIIIAKMSEPIFGLISEDKWKEIENQVWEFESDIEENIFMVLEEKEETDGRRKTSGKSG